MCDHKYTFSFVIQAALLYTNVFGQRRLRIHNLALSTSDGYGDIFRSCEINAIMNFFSKSSKMFGIQWDQELIVVQCTEGECLTLNRLVVFV